MGIRYEQHRSFAGKVRATVAGGALVIGSMGAGIASYKSSEQTEKFSSPSLSRTDLMRKRHRRHSPIWTESKRGHIQQPREIFRAPAAPKPEETSTTTTHTHAEPAPARKSAPNEVIVAITQAFGPDPQLVEEAIEVADCESDFDTTAENGQYKGTFQMGKNERATYGHGDSAIEQAEAAKRYHDKSGWDPWTCQP